ncbi:MAG: serine hydrolase [Patescibacteria group bacterium]
MIRRFWFYTHVAVFVSIMVFLIGVFSLHHDGVSKQLAISATTPLPVIVVTPELTTTTFGVFDVSSGAMLVAGGKDTIVPIASVAKLFAGAALVSHGPLNATTTIHFADLEAEGGAGKLTHGDEYSYQELLFPLLLESSNDAAATLGRASKGVILEKMNTLSQSVGATDTLFTDPSGFSDDTVSTVNDLQVLVASVYRNQPHVFDITLLPQYIGTQTGWMNNNPFVGLEGYKGGKHGYTTAAGRTAVAVFNEEIDGRTLTLGYIILGSTNLKADMQILRDSVHNSATEN